MTPMTPATPTNWTLKRGLNVPSLTVVDESGRLLEAEQRHLLRYLLQEGAGTDVVFGVGTTGEWNRLSNPERLRTMEVTIDEVARLNHAYGTQVEAWVGVNGKTKAEILTNLDAACQLGAAAAVIAPTAVEDLPVDEMVPFFQREITDLLETQRRPLPLFLYDNADIAAPGNAAHLPTAIVKRLSRLPSVCGIKVSASRRVLGNYMKAALHYRLPGEFGIYIGNALLIFDLYQPRQGFLGRLHEGWRDFLLHDTVPIGVVSGPGNVFPREWQKAWRVCWAGDVEAMATYRRLCGAFDTICTFEEGGRTQSRMLAGMKYALELDGVLPVSHVAPGTPALSVEQRAQFEERYRRLTETIRRETAAHWISRPVASPYTSHPGEELSAAERSGTSGKEARV